MGFLKTSVLTGFIWGVWHAPIILQGHNYPQHPVAGVTGLAGFITLFIINACIFIFDHFLSKEPVIFITQPGTGNR